MISDKSFTSANRFDKENPLFCDLSEGTKYALNAPGKDWNRDLSMPKVLIWRKEGCKNKKPDFWVCVTKLKHIDKPVLDVITYKSYSKNSISNLYG